MPPVQAFLTGGPAGGTTQVVPVRPPEHIDVELADDTPDVPIAAGEECPEITFTTHRYRLLNVEVDPRTGGQQAKYSWLRQEPNDG
jgi:hypothetical protein